MNKFIAAQQRLLIRAFITTLLLIVASVVLITDAYAQQEYKQPTPFSEAELAQMLAPIALYPDSLLTHILIASTYPLEIVQANRWRTANSQLDASLAIEKAQYENWDPSVTALLAFPNILSKLSDDLVWTQKLGSAFLQDEDALLASIQSLRQQADEAGSLSEMEYMDVTRVNQQIIIEPAQKEIIYVPYYNPIVVYGHWHWYNYPPVYWTVDPYYVPHQHGHFYWSGAVHVRFNYFFTTFNWQQHHILVVNHHNSDRYRPRQQIISSHGAQRWHYKSQPRHLRIDSHPKVQSNGLRPNRLPSINEQQRVPRKNSDDKAHSTKPLRWPDQPQISNRQSRIEQKHQPAAHQQHKEVKIPKQVKHQKSRNNSEKPRQSREQ